MDFEMPEISLKKTNYRKQAKKDLEAAGEILQDAIDKFIFEFLSRTDCDNDVKKATVAQAGE